MRLIYIFIFVLSSVSLLHGQDAEHSENKNPGEDSASALKLDKAELLENIDKLGSRYYYERAEAQEVIASQGKSAIPYLKKVLTSENVQLRIGALKALGKIEDSAAIEHIILMYADASLMVRHFAKRSLSDFGEKAVNEAKRLIDNGTINENSLNDELLADLYYNAVISILKTKIKRGDGGGFYAGLYDPVAELGIQAVPALLKICETLEIPNSRLEDHPTLQLNEFMIIMARFEDKKIIKKLKEIWKKNKDNETGQHAAISLAKLGHKEPLNLVIEKKLNEAGKNVNPSLYSDIARLYHRTSQYDESQTWYRRAAEAADMNHMDSFIYYYNLACAYSMGGKPDKAVEALYLSVEKGYINWPWMVIDKELDAIRDHEKYIELLEKNAPEYLPGNSENEKKDSDGNKETNENSGKGDN